MPENPLLVIPRLPRKRGDYGYRWGTSIFEDIASPIAEMNRRYSDMSEALEQQSKPMMTYRIADADREEISPDTDATTPFDEAIDDLGAELAKYEDQTQYALPDAIQGMEAVTWDPRASEQFLQVQEMQQAVEMAASIPGLFSGLMMEGAASGVALKRIMLRLYANTLQTQRSTEVAINELLSMSGESPVNWVNALAAMEDDIDDTEEEGVLE